MTADHRRRAQPAWQQRQQPAAQLNGEGRLPPQWCATSPRCLGAGSQRPMLMNIRQVRRRRFTRSENTYEAGSSSSVPFSWNSLIRESLLQTSWPISLSADSDDDEFDLFNPRR
ncbi:hypothetical protein HPB51_029753 [Rhipicephalus microplus]|uniref:Uncharacterized protein n=1 Tax=Rhipicephalus microplus TaxID=6941 RepID=A0A9J6CTU0_RHIMP|nr:hypothetical protein HPB51_029753 [Rhipicephalus microplus]